MEEWARLVAQHFVIEWAPASTILLTVSQRLRGCLSCHPCLLGLRNATPYVPTALQKKTLLFRGDGAPCLAGRWRRACVRSGDGESNLKPPVLFLLATNAKVEPPPPPFGLNWSTLGSLAGVTP